MIIFLHIRVNYKECGVRAQTSLIPLIVNGKQPNITEFPWHATLYRSQSSGGEKIFICGATIISNDLLITAAHCVYDEDIKRVGNADTFAVATGNIFRDYNSPLHDSHIVHKRNVSIQIISFLFFNYFRSLHNYLFLFCRSKRFILAAIIWDLMEITLVILQFYILTNLSCSLLFWCQYVLIELQMIKQQLMWEKWESLLDLDGQKQVHPVVFSNQLHYQLFL